MPKKHIVVEKGVILCEHGAEVELISSVPNHVIGGEKPLFDVDLLGAVVKGCGYNSNVGGQCKQVAAITSAVTETNVANNGKNYLLRVDGCQTDNGSSLVLVNPGQTTTVVPVKSGGSAGSITQKALEDAKVNTKENIKNEKYRLFPLRKSGENYRALRGCRDFQVMKNFHHVSAGNYQHDKIVTQTDAYIYIKEGKQSWEYRVINNSDLFKPEIQKVYFKDMETGVVRKYIPFYKESGTLDIIYSNIRLSEADKAHFKALTITVEDAKTPRVKHHKNYSKKPTCTNKELREVFITQEEAKALKKPYQNLVIEIEDPIGEVEDLYHEYEFSYHRHYGMNKALIDDIRAKNQYAYAIADMLDYMYVSTEEKKNYQKQNEALKQQYKKLISLMKSDMIPSIEEYMHGINIKPAVDMDLAKEYYDEICFIDKSFFDGEYIFSLELKKGKHTYTNNRRFRGKRLMFSTTKDKTIKNSAMKVLAYLTFSVCFSKKYETSRTPKLAQEAENFYYMLKKAKPLPQLNETVLDEVQEELKHQNDLVRIFEGEDALLDEYETLDTAHKSIAYDPKTAQNKRYYHHRKTPYGFSALKVGEERGELFYNKELQTPKELGNTIAIKLTDSKLKTVIDAYQKVQSFNSEQDEHDYYHYLLNLITMLVAPRSEYDEETQTLSVFNSDNTHILSLVEHLSDKLNSIGEIKAKKLHDESIKTYYLKAIYTLITHASLEKTNAKLPERKTGQLQIFSFKNSDDKGRSINVENFLKKYAQPVNQQGIKTDKPMDNNFDKKLKVKTEGEKLYATLKQIDGISSYLGKVHDTAVESVDKMLDDTFGGDENKFEDFDKSKSSKYQKLLASTKALSFLITIGKIAEFSQNKDKYKIHNLIGFAGDTLSASSYIAGLAEKVKGNPIPMAKSIPESLEHIMKIDKVVSPSSMKIITRFGLVGVMASAVNELSEIDPEKNEDYLISVGVKNALYVALLFSPAWVALGGIIVIELTWAFLSDRIKNSPMELFLYDSLLFDTLKHNDARWFNDIQTQKAYRSVIMNKSLDSAGVKHPQGFNNMNETREFIAMHYKANPSAFDNAMRNELTHLKSILYDFNIILTDMRTHNKVQTNGMTFYIGSEYGVKLSNSLYDKVEDVYLGFEEYLNAHSKQMRYKKLVKSQSYDVTQSIINESKSLDNIVLAQGFSSDREKIIWMQNGERHKAIKKMFGEVYFITVVDNISIKHHVQYKYISQYESNFANIEKIAITQMKQEDYDGIKDLK